LGEIEEHLGVTINRVGSDMAVPINEYDGKVVYGSKKANGGWRKKNAYYHNQSCFFQVVSTLAMQWN
jgi:ATP-dependent RNA helicase DDX1